MLFICIRFISIFESTVYFDPYDSPSYFAPTLSNPLRMPFISYFFSWISYYGGIVLLQSLIAIFSWCFLAYAVSRVLLSNIAKILSLISILSLGLTSPIVEHDILMLSESLTISFFNLIVGSVILYKINQNLGIVLTICLSTIIYAGIKQSNSYFSMIILLLLFIAIVTSSKSTRRKIWTIALCVTPAMIVNVWLINIGRQNNLIANQVVLTNIIERTYDDYLAQKWWLDSGLPAIAFQRYTSPYTLPPINMTRNSAQVKAWELGENNLVLEKFAFSDLRFLVFAPLDPKSYISVFTDHEAIFNPLAKGTRLASNNSYLNLEPNQKPGMKNLNLPLTFWWSDNANYSKALLVILILPIVLVLIFHSRKNYNSKLIQIFIVFFAVNVWAIWHISVTYELTRYLLPWAIFLRIISIISLGSLIDLVIYSKLKDNLINKIN